MDTRTETDSLGEVQVPQDKLWGAQTARSLSNFSIGEEKMPLKVIHALVLIKKASAITNAKLGVLSEEKKEWIIDAANEILFGKHDDQFPLSLWQTGSGTQSNMNVNEVIANLVAQKEGMPLGKKAPLHPNDDVNCSQSSNDTFPSAMHLAASQEVVDRLLPSLRSFSAELQRKSAEWMDVIKVGRTHMMDAAPLRLGQEFSGYHSQMEQVLVNLENGAEELYALALGGTAVGTGLNAPKGFAEGVANEIAEITGRPFKTATNKFSALAANDALVSLSGILKRLAGALMKMANDIRLMASGPRAGFAELFLPENEPGSSIMPGKVNPTQVEALTMVAVQVMGNDVSLGIAGSQGNFELNVYRPLIIYNFLQSVRLLSDGMDQFREKCLEGIRPNREKIERDLEHSLMLATALNRVIGYDKASKIVRLAHEKGVSLKEAAMELKLLTEKEFDEIVDPAKMVE